MKKIIKFILILMILIGIAFGIALLLPNLKRTCKIENYNITLKVPYAYAESEEETENTLLNLYNSENGIAISAIDLKDDFWASGDVEARMDEYMRVISAANYDSQLKNPTLEVLEKYEGKLGVASLELENLNGGYKSIAVITNEEVGNLVIEFIGSVENVSNNMEEIEEIIDSIEL